MVALLLLFVSQALLSYDVTSGQNTSQINWPSDDDHGEAWRQVLDTYNRTKSQELLSAFDQILLANAHSYGMDRGDDTNNLYQGDIDIEHVDMMELITGKELSEHKGRQRRAVTKNSRRLWGKNIPYYLSRDLGNEAVGAIKEAIGEWETTLPCLGPWKSLSNSGRRPQSYLHFIKGKGCYSKVGRTGGRQEISVGSKCEFRGVVVHEIGHAMGFWHEHSRPDRDKYVEIKWGNIIPDMKYNFEKYSRRKVDDLGVEYDYQSIMHYGAKAFSRDGKLDTLFIKNKNARNIKLGQRSGLSARDKRQARLLYGCEVQSKECKDTEESCSGWAQSGYCSDVKYNAYMIKNCCHSCSLLKKVPKQPCSFSPCLNGGTCSNYGNRFKCRCTPSYTGKKCELKKQPCHSSPCLNGGFCVNKVNTYQCNCLTSYSGRRCERKYNPCSSSPCHNGGKCVSQGNTFKCVCSSSFKGVRCERKVVASNVCKRNLRRQCSSWITHCKTGGKHYKFMKTNCCKTCEAYRNRYCRDKNGRCQQWKSVGFCTGRFETYMNKNCAKSCGKC